MSDSLKTKLTPEKIALYNCDKGFMEDNSIISDDWKLPHAKNVAENIRLGYISTNTKDSVAFFTGEFAGRVGIVMGTGPSLDENLKALANSALIGFGNKGYVTFCGPSSYCNALYHGITPDFMVAYDASECTADHFRKSPKTNTRLITHPCIHPKVISTWKGGDIFWFLSRQSDYHDFLVHMFPYLQPVASTGCVVSEQILIAALMGCSEIVLIGCDFAFTGDKLRAEKHVYNNYGWYNISRSLEDDAIKISKRPVAEVDDIHGNTIATWAEMLRYRSHIHLFGKQLKEKNVRLLNGTGQGILTELGQVDFEQYVKAFDAIAFHNACDPSDKRNFKFEEWYPEHSTHGIHELIKNCGEAAIDPDFKPNLELLKD